MKATDSSVYRQAWLLLPRLCAACKGPPASVHHVLPKGSPYHGDDVLPNLCLLCGHGSAGCHGAFHGAPFVDWQGRRWTTQGVKHAIGETLRLHRPDTIAYVRTKLGDVAGADYLERVYGIRPE